MEISKRNSFQMKLIHSERVWTLWKLVFIFRSAFKFLRLWNPEKCSKTFSRCEGHFEHKIHYNSSRACACMWWESFSCLHGRQRWFTHTERAVLLERSLFSSKFPCNSGAFSEVQQQLKMEFKTESSTSTLRQLILTSMTTVTFMKWEMVGLTWLY